MGRLPSSTAAAQHLRGTFLLRDASTCFHPACKTFRPASTCMQNVQTRLDIIFYDYRSCYIQTIFYVEGARLSVLIDTDFWVQRPFVSLRTVRTYILNAHRTYIHTTRAPYVHTYYTRTIRTYILHAHHSLRLKTHCAQMYVFMYVFVCMYGQMA